MTSLFCKILFASALSLGSCIASAAPLHYEFSTVLKLSVGPDTDGLNGATMHFTAEIADGTVWKPDIFNLGFKTFDALSHQMTISGSGSADGNYADPDGASFAQGFGWSGLNGDSFDFGLFEAAPYFSVILYQTTADVQYGDLVRPEDFEEFAAPSWPYLALWNSSGSSYTWIDNAQFSVTETSVSPRAVPLPFCLSLLTAALCGLVGLWRGGGLLTRHE